MKNANPLTILQNLLLRESFIITMKSLIIIIINKKIKSHEWILKKKRKRKEKKRKEHSIKNSLYNMYSLVIYILNHNFDKCYLTPSFFQKQFLIAFTKHYALKKNKISYCTF